MKRVPILIITLLISISAFSQYRSERPLKLNLVKGQPVKLNELKLNLPTTIFALYPEISYERLLDSDISIGASVGFNLADEYMMDFAFTPYFRWFFGGKSRSLERYGAGFFIEVNGSIFSPVNDTNTEINGDVVEKDLGAGLGLGLGWKYVTRNDWVGEIFFGGGRDFANDDAYPRMGISIGKRF
ncbi:MAG: hypothetical protein PHY69_01055 [Dysgonamonadaceae bacterium]|nr:hypothetical protein [Dysgonamonadaceae bacterium]MDD3308531.1 hypothetical protein [Dysgonamonadaceae bacterium]MDD3899932.1 hypothetical protein [Dysgonamonadaceae bacterium]MDD4398709.1 hypothetical protein [Dysgonamonadaceae bacterium]